jgi:hypothetical protein
MEGTRLLIVLGVYCALVAIVYREPISAFVIVPLAPISKPTPELSEVCLDFETRKEHATTNTPSLLEHPLGLHVLHEPRTQGNTLKLICTQFRRFC